MASIPVSRFLNYLGETYFVQGSCDDSGAHIYSLYRVQFHAGGVNQTTAGPVEMKISLPASLSLVVAYASPGMVKKLTDELAAEVAKDRLLYGAT